jgi:hypothetical protein
VLNAAAGQVRAECDWHIAPEVTETLTLETDCGTVVLLPSLYVKSVDEVRSEDGTVLTGWKWRQNGVLRYKSGWPDVIEVDLVHGYTKCPDELVAVVAERAQRIKGGGVKSESLAGRSVSLEVGPGQVSAEVVARYTRPGRP